MGRGYPPTVRGQGRGLGLLVRKNNFFGLKWRVLVLKIAKHEKSEKDNLH